ncbi:MAG: deoxynucleoside kinase [bacterium]|nr:deoxynucleoside kinase [bacterium]
MGKQGGVLNARYIAVEGVIGAGKTSLAKILQRHFGGQLVMEQHEENPFLPDFYRDSQRFGFQTQIFFLLSRWKQQQELTQLNLFHDRIVSDYLFAKDKIFASMNLQERELELYEKLLEAVESSVVKPDLVVYLQASVQRLMYNIQLRGRSYEKDMSEEYITGLSDAYNHFFSHYHDSPLLVINATKLDFVGDVKQQEAMLAFIADSKFTGTRFYPKPEE